MLFSLLRGLDVVELVHFGQRQLAAALEALDRLHFVHDGSADVFQLTIHRDYVVGVGIESGSHAATLLALRAGDFSLAQGLSIHNFPWHVRPP
jgi:hypothetical protein